MVVRGSRHRTVFAVVVGVAYLLSGVGGVVAGGGAAAAGWWLVVVGLVLVVLARIEDRTGQTR